MRFSDAAIVVLAIAASLPALPAGIAQTMASGNTHNGEQVYRQQGCDKCHGAWGEGLSSPTLPRIASTPLALPAFLQSIRKPKGPMPPYGSQQVSDSELTDVYAFLKATELPAQHEGSTASHAKNGQQLYVKYGCAECHLTWGQGARSTGGTQLGPPQIPLSAFMRYVRRPTREMPPYTGKTVSDGDLADIYAYLQSQPQAASWKTIPLLNP
ncbi:MAG: c-type cytochrome [Acidobacteriota bacterium]|nr:c-type cytochrome [Acidobacteriota bacterium]